MFKPGDLLRYYYLWARQADAGEESGRKARPVCIVVRTPTTPAALFLFPLTSQQPHATRTYIAISEIECRRGGLDFPSWLILDEYNRARVDEAYDLVTTKPIGSFSPAFVRKIAGLIKEAAEERRLRGVVRK
ncbi:MULTISPECIES: hypothetical protein [unclassified Mesorhizobium]|uniref:hypothetical protein n=1 Tax=unclassified Mesorhizobium TaxID=325217 RepID=UPI0015E3B718|nr:MULTISPECIES: hypothetical protein [unclassified Mesorhizobium]UCI25162.1 hypothetical protein FJ430_26890 [Mesorhizobium sp. B2-8-5]